MLLAALLMVVSSIAAQVHELTVRDVRCAEHGETWELRNSPPSHVVQPAGPGLQGAEHNQGHNHGCLVPVTPVARADSAKRSSLGHGAVQGTVVLMNARVDSAHPLRYAPKTSPPWMG